jgi:hypothetical protein
MATLILVLVIVSIVLDSYLIFGLGLSPKSNVVLILLLFIIVLYAVFVIWMANRTCYNFTWISWLILLYIVWVIINSIIVITDPPTQEKVRNEMNEIDKQFDETQNKQQ